MRLTSGCRLGAAVLVIAGQFLPVSALAYGYRGSYGLDELNHLLSVGGGIASPSVTSALGENPAGLMYNTRTKVQAATATGSESLNPVGFGGLLFGGNGFVGGGIGLQGFNNQTEGGGQILLLNWGLAAEFTSLNMAFGFTGTRTLHRSGVVMGTGSGTTWCVDTGVIINPHGSSRYGLTLFQILDSVDAIGAGWAIDASSWSTFALDGTYSPDSKSAVVKPGLSLQFDGFQMSSGYGFRAVGDSGSWIRQGLSLGVGFNLGDHMFAQMYYNHIALYYGGITFRL